MKRTKMGVRERERERQLQFLNAENKRNKYADESDTDRWPGHTTLIVFFTSNAGRPPMFVRSVAKQHQHNTHRMIAPTERSILIHIYTYTSTAYKRNVYE